MPSLLAYSHCWTARPEGQDPESFSATAAALTLDIRMDSSSMWGKPGAGSAG